MTTRGHGFSVGMSTAVDVTRLVEHFGSLEVGTLVPYAKVEEVLRVPRAQDRFRTVTNAWRKKLEREQNLILECAPNQGFRVLTNVERVGHSARYFKQGIKRTSIAGRRAASTSRAGLAVEDVRTLDHVMNTSALFKVQAALEARKLREIPPVAQQPAA
jgi:hypothetical protein